MKMYAKLSRNLVVFPDTNVVANNQMYKDTAIGYKLKTGTTYTVAFDYKFNSVEASDGSTAPRVYIGVGYGNTVSYLADIIYSTPYPNQTSGRAVVVFITPDEFQAGKGDLLCVRFIRTSIPVNANVDISKFTLVKGAFEALPYEPYMPIQPIKFLYKSRQLFDRSLPKFSGWAYIDNFTDNTITVIERQNVASTTTWRSINIPIYGLEEGDTITISGEWVNSSNNKGAVMVRWFEPSSLGVGKISSELQTSGGVATGVVTAKPTETAQLCVALYINTNGTLAQYDTVTYKNVMVCKGDKALPYEPYMPLTKMKAFYKSRNLFDIRKITGLKNSSGSLFNDHFIVSGDELTVKYGAYGFGLYLVGNERYLKVGDYTMSCLVKNNEDFATATKLTLRNEELGNIESPRRTVAAGEEIELTYTFSITQEGIYYFSLQPDGNASKYTNLNFVFSKIMFNKGSTALPYEPPQEYPN